MASSSAFAQLMKLSQSQTAESEQAIQSQIESHRRLVEQRKREQDAKEKREREIEMKLRLKRLEDMQREEERKKKRAEEEEKKRKEMERKEEQMRMALKYGPKKAASNGKGKGGNANGGYNKSGPVDGDDEGENDGLALTREEKRERKLAAQLRRGMSSSSSTYPSGSRRSTALKNLASLPDGRTVRRLPGGAVDVTVISKLANPEGSTSASTSASTSTLTSSTSQSKPAATARERLAALPATLVKLNTVKRDLRTIDEILLDRAKAKNKVVLDGDNAKDFSDWFGKKSKEKKEKEEEDTKKNASKVAKSSASPKSPDRRLSPTPQVSSSSSSSSLTATMLPPRPQPAPPTTVPKSKPPASSKPNGTSGSSFLKSINPKPAALGSTSAASKPTSSLKRPRTPSPTPPNVKRRTVGNSNGISSSIPRAAATAVKSTSTISRSVPSKPSTTSNKLSRNATRDQERDRSDMDPLDISNTIWSLFGKDKQRYAALDRFSDEEEDMDMEADARSVLKEEARSARLAMKEDEDAFAEEKRREEEKRRRKKERERREREKAGY